MRYSAKDLERSRRWARERALYDDRGIAELIADVRHETIEECAHLVRNHSGASPTIRALLDEPKAEPLCGRCGGAKTDPLHNTWVPDPLHHNFKPEEPGHG